MRARVVDAHDDLLPYRPVVFHLGVLPFVPDAVRVRVVFDHCDSRAGRGGCVERGDPSDELFLVPAVFPRVNVGVGAGGTHLREPVTGPTVFVESRNEGGEN